MPTVRRTAPYLGRSALAVLLALGVVGCDGRGGYVRIDAPDHVQLLVEERRTLDVDVTADGAADPGLAWTSLDPAVAAVADDGTVTGVAAGATRITVASTALPDERRNVDVDVLTAADHPAWVAAPDARPAMRFDVGVRTTPDGPVAVVRNANARPEDDGRRAQDASAGPGGAAVGPTGPTCPEAAEAPVDRVLVRYASPPTAATDVTARPSPWTRVRRITDTLHVVEADAARGAVRTAAAR
ncbi:MAG: Ig-like domain-containing protein, partial [Trueperaceae bacterium]|nr:Ig-like domain-containing protein [Trueperaceae bacterium]